MSFGNGYNGGRTRMGNKVFLNLYDLSPMNEYLYPIGFGFHHSGVEILGTEYSYGSGAGIFEQPPKAVPNAKFRCQLELGSYDGGIQELNRILDQLRSPGPGPYNFGPTDYNLVSKNCNHFANALVWKLLGKTIPSYVNRWADIGTCCSCLLPKQLLEEAPVGGSNNNNNNSIFAPTNASMRRGGGNAIAPGASVFSGTGHRLQDPDPNASPITDGLFSKWTSKSNSKTHIPEDLTDRRERARKAALARLERNQHPNSD